MKKLCLLVFFSIGVCSCAPIIDTNWKYLTTPPEIYQLNVPFIQQAEEGLCGSVALSIILNYWGIDITQQQIADAIYLPSLQGILSFDLMYYAREQGLHAELYEGSFKDLRENIRNGNPLIVALGANTNELGHYIVIVGYDDVKQHLLGHDGKTAYRAIPYTIFFRVWQKMNNLTILVTPNQPI